MKLVDDATRNLFFTGKGGVGKTSVASASAVQLADEGKRVLLVSTDPASNLDDVFGLAIQSHPTPIDTINNLWAMNLDPEQAAAEYRERMVAPYRDALPEEAINSMEEQFSGACTMEIAAFNEFARLLGDPDATSQFDHVIFDTAPTGHTLRLLSLPSAWTGFMNDSTTGTSCLGPLSGLRDEQALYQQTVSALSDAGTTTLVLVARPEAAALREAERTSTELLSLGVRNQHFVINGLFSASRPGDPVADAIEERGARALAEIPSSLAALPTTRIPLHAGGILGIDALRQFSSSAGSIQAQETAEPDRIDEPINLTPFGVLIDELAAGGPGVVLAMGKGGVGKTTVAAATAVALAQRGLDVHLTTTDPAAHLVATMGDAVLPNLTVERIDPVAETRSYSAEVLERAGAGLDEAGRALLEEDLRSPCTEEIAVFRAFARAVAEGEGRMVVLDTAPTGHTILLLDSALAYHREVSRQESDIPDSVSRLLPRLRDPAFTRVLIVALPEATPVNEAAMLQRDLRRAEIEPFAWVLNQVLEPLPITDPVLCQRRRYERRYLDEVQSRLARRTVFIPLQLAPPTGLKSLQDLSVIESST